MNEAKIDHYRELDEIVERDRRRARAVARINASVALAAFLLMLGLIVASFLF